MPEIDDMQNEQPVTELDRRMLAVEHLAAEAHRIASATEVRMPRFNMPAAPLVSPYLQSAGMRHADVETPLPTGYASATDVRHFGVTVSAFDETLSDSAAQRNLAFLQQAIDWSAVTGGLIQLPAGSVDIYGTAIWRLGAGIRGVGKHSSRLRQRCIPRSDTEPFSDLLVCPPVEGRTGGTGFTLLSDLILDGGWNMRNHATAQGAPNWSYDPARMTQRAVVYDTPRHGTSHGSASRDAGSDAHNRLDNVTVTNVAGYGICMSGRGENFIRGVELRKCAISGLYLDSPDCFVSDLTSYTHGDCGIVITARAGNLRFSNSKLWFTGMQRDAEVIGAGIYLPDMGTSALTMSNISTQDTWGPGLHLSGNAGITFHGDLDEAGGGRLEQQQFGYGGRRSQPRCFVRAEGTLRRARIEAQISGGGRCATAPHLVHISGSGVAGCEFRLGGDLSDVDETRVIENAGSRNTGRHNEVWFGQRLLYGQVTEAQLADPTHGVNDPDYGPSIAYTDDGKMLVRNAQGVWQTAGNPGEISVLAFEPWDEAGFQAALARHASDPKVWVVRYGQA